MRDIFTNIYHENGWRDKDSKSGRGSNLEQTAHIRMVLPQIFSELGVRYLLDIPCGDFFWFKEMAYEMRGIKYIGADIVPELIDYCNANYSDENHTFIVTDVTKHRPPEADLIFCRDLLGHLTNDEVRKVLKNFRASGTRYLMATTFPDRDPNVDIKTGEWRPIDLEALRYGLGPATLLINERCTDGDGHFSDKSLGLWEL